MMSFHSSFFLERRPSATPIRTSNLHTPTYVHTISRVNTRPGVPCVFLCRCVCAYVVVYVMHKCTYPYTLFIDKRYLFTQPNIALILSTICLQNITVSIPLCLFFSCLFVRLAFSLPINFVYECVHASTLNYILYILLNEHNNQCGVSSSMLYSGTSLLWTPWNLDFSPYYRGVLNS